MFNDRIKELRKIKGFSQEELAIQLNIESQIVSKWEGGLAVPDAALLIRMAEVFKVPISKLLGVDLMDEKDVNGLAEQLSKINEQFAMKNCRSRRIWKWKTIAVIIAALIIINIFLIILSLSASGGWQEWGVN